jgi:hypothetical protein
VEGGVVEGGDVVRRRFGGGEGVHLGRSFADGMQRTG